MFFHFHCGKLSRAKGRNFCDKANYILKQPILCERTGELFDRNDRKQEVVYRAVFLPANANTDWREPSVLANAVETFEKHSSAKIAYDLDSALDKRWDRETQISVARREGEYLASLGMCVIMAIHDKGDGNPHAHYLCTARSLDNNGQFLIKEKKVYALDDDGNKIPVLGRDGKQKMTKRKYIDKEGNEQVCYSPQWKRILQYEEPLNDKGLYQKIRHQFFAIVSIASPTR